MAGGVTGAVAHGELTVADLHGVAIMQPARGGERRHLREAEHAALLGDAVDPELVARVRADDGQAEPLAQLGGAAGMVDVRVGEPDLRRRHAQLAQRRLDTRQVTARIDDRGLPGGFAPDDGAVLREGRHRHGPITQRWGCRSGHGHEGKAGPESKNPAVGGIFDRDNLVARGGFEPPTFGL